MTVSDVLVICGEGSVVVLVTDTLGVELAVCFCSEAGALSPLSKTARVCCEALLPSSSRESKGGPVTGNDVSIGPGFGVLSPLNVGVLSLGVSGILGGGCCRERGGEV